MVIAMSCLSDIIDFLAIGDYNLDFTIKIKFERINYILMGDYKDMCHFHVRSLMYACLYVVFNFHTESLINIYTSTSIKSLLSNKVEPYYYLIQYDRYEIISYAFKQSYIEEVSHIILPNSLNNKGWSCFMTIVM